MFVRKAKSTLADIVCMDARAVRTGIPMRTERGIQLAERFRRTAKPNGSFGNRAEHDVLSQGPADRSNVPQAAVKV